MFFISVLLLVFRPLCFLRIRKRPLTELIRVDWSFLRSTLYVLRFGKSLIAWVDLFYKNFYSAVIVNVSSYFFISGLRQGCPQSPLLYILVAEVLACNIRAHSLISGLRFPHSSVPLSYVSAYADETTLVDTSTRASIPIFL